MAAIVVLNYNNNEVKKHSFLFYSPLPPFIYRAENPPSAYFLKLGGMKKHNATMEGMKMETRNKGIKAIQIFIDFERIENRLPTKKEFDLAWYGRELPRGRSNYYYQVKKKFLEEVSE